MLSFHSLLLLFISVQSSFQRDAIIKNENCRICNFLVATFAEGLRQTNNQHFAGGDTAWEEKNLGKYATSETRLIEVLEGVCKKSTLPNMDRFTGLDQLEFKCSSQLEHNEELIEQYYYKHQATNISIWLCVDKLKYCCPDGHFGKLCDECPGLSEGAVACFGRGKCHGEGSREGRGVCKCDTGYAGKMCRHCDADYFEESKDKTSITCKKCYEGCLGTCTEEGPKGCTKCRDGWNLSESEGCIDIDECASSESCTKDNEKCVNTVGSFRCDCVEDYKRDAEGSCQLDVEAAPYRMFVPPDQLLRGVSMALLVFVITIVSIRRSTVLYLLTALAVVACILVELYVTPNTIPDEAKRIMGYY